MKFPHKNYILSLFFIFQFLPLFASLGWANTDQIKFESDNVTVNQNDGSLLATGNVELKQANNTLRADEVTYYRDQNRAIAPVMLFIPMAMAPSLTPQ